MRYTTYVDQKRIARQTEKNLFSGKAPLVATIALISAIGAGTFVQMHNKAISKNAAAIEEFVTDEIGIKLDRKETRKYAHVMSKFGFTMEDMAFLAGMINDVNRLPSFRKRQVDMGVVIKTLRYQADDYVFLNEDYAQKNLMFSLLAQYADRVDFSQEQKDRYARIEIIVRKFDHAPRHAKEMIKKHALDAEIE